MYHVQDSSLCQPWHPRLKNYGSYHRVKQSVMAVIQYLAAVRGRKVDLHQDHTLTTGQEPRSALAPGKEPGS